MKKIFEWIKEKLNIHFARCCTYTAQVIKFGEINRNGIMFDKDMKIEISGKVKNMIIDEHGIKAIKSFDLKSISLTNSKKME